MKTLPLPETGQQTTTHDQLYRERLGGLAFYLTKTILRTPILFLLFKIKIIIKNLNRIKRGNSFLKSFSVESWVGISKKFFQDKSDRPISKAVFLEVVCIILHVYWVTE